MLRLAADNLVAAATNLDRMAHDFANMDKERPIGYLTPLIPKSLDILERSIGEIRKIASDLKLDASLAAANNCASMLGLFSRSTPNVVTIQSHKINQVVLSLHALNTALNAQLSSRAFYSIESTHEKYLSGDAMPFGKEVAAAFPEAQDDIAEAGKCLALERYTAVVFHLMRAMEIALREVATKLNATIQDSSGAFLTWGIMAENVKRKIDTLEKGPERDAWHGLHSHFDSVNRAWRNKTMHPQQSYTADQAGSVLSSTKGFMQSLAPLI